MEQLLRLYLRLTCVESPALPLFPDRIPSPHKVELG